MTLFNLNHTKELVSQNSFKAQAQSCNSFDFINKPSLKEFDLKLKALNKYESLVFKTDGKCSLHEMIGIILHQLGPSKLTFCTWKITEEPLRAMVDFISKGLVIEINALFDYRIEETTPKAFQLALGMASRFKLSKVHAKVMVIEGSNESITIIGSANLTTNPRIEAGVLFTAKSVAEFNKNWILEQINEPNTRTAN